MTIFTTYDAVGIKEDVSEKISNISPTTTPFQTLIGSGKAKQRHFEWQEDELAAPRDNAQVEGFTATDATLAPTVLRDNYTQIFEKTVKISATEDAVDQHGRAKETAYQLVKASKELKRDVERAYVGVDQGMSPGTSTAPRRTASAFSMIDASVIVDDGPAAALTEAMVLTAGQKAYDNGGEPSILMIKPGDSLRVAGFANAAGRNRDIRNDTKLVNVVDLYVSPFGEYKVVLNRFILASAALLFDPGMWEEKTLRPFTREPLSKTGDNSMHMLVGEKGLAHKNFKACASIMGLL